MNYKIAWSEKCQTNQVKNQIYNYEELKELLSSFKAYANTPGIISGHHREETRIEENLHSKSVLFLDVDKYNSHLSDLEALLEQEIGVYRYLAYSTKSHATAAPRVRIVLFLISEVTCDEYRTIAETFIDSLADELKNAIDPASSKPNQLMYLPHIPRNNKDYEPWWKENLGELDIDPEIYAIPTVKEKKSYSEEIAYDEDDPLLQITLEDTSYITDEQIKTFLNTRPAEGYTDDQWLKMGMALHLHYKGSDDGFNLWNEWSVKDQRLGKYKGLRHLKSRWKSFGKRKRKRVTLKSFFNEAERDEKIKKVGAAKRLNSDIWLHTKGEKEIPQFTNENFAILMREYNIDIKFDIIKKETLIWINGEFYCNNNVALTEIKSLCELNHMSRNPAHEAVEYVAEYNRVNSWKDWITSIAWDGVDRLGEFYETVQVASEHIVLRNLYIHKWLLQMIHMTCLNTLEQPKSARNVLIFQGEQGIGKTTWLTSLVPKNMSNYVLVGQSVNSSRDMDIFSCIEHVFVELGEVTSTMRKTDVENLKNFISKPVDSLNRKYKKDPENHRRTTVFFGTTNETNFLTDMSGSTRFFILPVLKCNGRHDIDMQQLYAQLLSKANQHSLDEYNLTDDEKILQRKANGEFEMGSELEDFLLEAYNPEDMNCKTVMNASIILKELGYSENQINKNKRNEMGAILNKHKFKKCTSPKGWYMPSKRVVNMFAPEQDYFRHEEKIA